MKNSLLTITVILILSFFISGTGRIMAQTSGTLTFTVNPVSHNSSYGLDHLVAIWVQNVGNTKYKMSGNSDANAHLAIWKAASGGSVVDATSGASLTSYAPINISWNATNVSSVVVPDGVYRVLVEFAWGSSTVIGSGKDTMSVTFNKSTSPVHLTPANRTNFTGIVLDWAPLGVSVKENPWYAGIKIGPNPSSGLVNINCGDEMQGCILNVYNSAGSVVYQETVSGSGTANTIDLSRNVNGIYYMTIQKDSQSKGIKHKLLISK
jgi:hypothetical protein